MSHWLSSEGRAKSIAAGTINLRRFAELGADRRWRGRTPVPKNVHPLVRRFFEIMRDNQTLLGECADRAGLLRATISDWRYRRNPTITNFEAALNALGYELRIVQRREKRRKAA